MKCDLTRRRAARGGATAILLVGAAVGGCEPTGGAAPFATVAETDALRVVAQGPVERSGDGAGRVEVTFSAALDPATVGPRSIRLLRSGSARPIPIDVTVSGRALRVVFEPGRGAVRGETLQLVLEGAPSPRALRAAGGQALPRRTTLDLPTALGRADLTGPALVSTHPSDGAEDVTPGTAVELRFSEPIARTSVDDAVSVLVRGERVAARARASSDRRRLLVRPRSPLPPGTDVDVAVNPWVADDAGNPLDAGSARVVRFRTKSTVLSEIREEFVSDEMADFGATTALWGAAPEPDLLVGRGGLACPITTESAFTADLGARETLHFQLLVRREDVCGALGSALRLRLSSMPERLGEPIGDVTVEGGTFRLDDLDPAFDGNRRFAELEMLADASAHPTWEPDGLGGGICEIPFRAPLLLDPTRPALLDVSISIPRGARVAATTEAAEDALVESMGRERLRPLAALVTSGGAPSARSRWYDTNCAAPRWQPARAVRLGAGTQATIEFQAAPDDGSGCADDDAVSGWKPRLDMLPPWRFVRFRVRFDGATGGSPAPAIDSVTMPFVSSPQPR